MLFNKTIGLLSVVETIVNYKRCLGVRQLYKKDVYIN